MRKWVLFGGTSVLVAALGGTALFLSRSQEKPTGEHVPPTRIFIEAPKAVEIPENVALTRIKANATDVDALVALGDSQLRSRKFRLAEQTYVKALALKPDLPNTWSALGEARMQFQTVDGPRMPPGAAEAFGKALALNPKDPRARFYMTMQRDFLGEHEAAIGEWLDQLSQVPAGSDADEAIRAAMIASMTRNQRIVANAMREIAKTQPRIVEK